MSLSAGSIINGYLSGLEDFGAHLNSLYLSLAMQPTPYFPLHAMQLPCQSTKSDMFEEQIKRHKLAGNGDISSALEKPIYSLSQQIKALSFPHSSPRPEGLATISLL